MKKRMTEYIGAPAMLELLAEESAELAQAALKLARVMRQENPTPVTEQEAKSHLIEEYTDVVQCAEDLGLFVDMSQIKVKKERFERRYYEHRNTGSKSV